MRIRQLQLIRYGKFTGRSLDLPPATQDIHLVVGPNEAGKSTLRSAIGDWLFGIHPRTPLAFLHAMPDLRLGGTLQRLGESPAELVFERAKGNRNTLRAPDDRHLPEDTLQPWLGTLDATTFNRMYALEHRTLVEGGAGILNASDDLGRLLFQSAAGIEHLGTVLKNLEAEADAQWGPRKAASREYYQAQEQFEAAGDALKKATLRTRDWKARHDALQDAAQALDDARRRHADLRAQLARLERIRRVMPTLAALGTARTRLQALLEEGDVALLPEDAAASQAEASQAAALAEADIHRLQQEAEAAAAALAAVAVDDALLAQADDITTLNEQRLQYRAHRHDIALRREEVRVEWTRVAELAASLGWPAADEAAVRQRLPAPSVRTRLARLLQAWRTLDLQRHNAEAALQEREQAVQRLQAALEQQPAAAASPALAAAVEQAQALGDPAAALAELQARLDQQHAALETALAGLGVWRQPPETLRAMAVPPVAVLQSLLAERQADAAEQKSLQASAEAQATEQRRVALALDQLVRSFQPVSREQLQAARRERDAAWVAIRQAPDALRERAPAFEQHMAGADQLADARLERAQHEAERQAQVQRLETLALEQATLQQRLQTLRERAAQREQRWADLCSAAGLPALPLDLAPGWLEGRTRALEAAEACAALQRQRDARQAAVQAARRVLWAHLGPACPADPHAGSAAHAGAEEQTGTAPPLAECLRRAREQLAAAAQASGQRSMLQRQLQEAQHTLASLQQARTAAAQAWDAWQLAWRDAARAAGHADTVFPDQVEAELGVLDEMDAGLARIRSHRTERIDTMQADLRALADAVQALTARVAPELQGLLPEDAVQELVRRLAQARQDDATRRQARTRAQQAATGLAQAQRQREAARARLAPLLQTAGVHELPALARAIERSDQRRALEREIARATDSLHQAGDGLPLAQLQLDADSTDPTSLRLELERLQPLAEAAVEQMAGLTAQHATLQQAFDALNGSDEGAQAEAQRQEALARMSDAVTQYLQLHTAARLLKWSMEKFRETRQGPMLARASATFARLTGGSFGRLLVDTDGATPRLYGVRPDGKPVDVAGMSEGSRDQLYLALRLAALELQIDQGRALPLIADDLFINFDDQRTAAGLQVLGELSRRMQVVFLTHHEHLVPLAREVLGAELNVVTL